MALSAKMDGKTYRTYVVVGEGEMAEGTNYEGMMAAGHYKLDNLTAFLDFNGLQIDGDITKVMNPTPVDQKYEAFGWHVITIDGHDYDAIRGAIAEAKTVKGKPTMIIAKTIKGKGVSFMENQAGWHGNAPNDEQYETAMADLTKILAEVGA